MLHVGAFTKIQREMGLEFFWLIYSYPGLNQSAGRSILKPQAYGFVMPCSGKLASRLSVIAGFKALE